MSCLQTKMKGQSAVCSAEHRKKIRLSGRFVCRAVSSHPEPDRTNTPERGPMNYKHTIYACFTGYIVQAVVNNFAPLLFLRFNSQFGIPLAQITLLITINFGIQLAVDLISAFIVDRIGYRICIVAAHVFSAAGLIMMAVLPGLLGNAYTGLLIAVFFYAVGGGLLEVLVSPIVEACPTKNKEQTMSILHSFYCWGVLGVVLISTAFFALFGIGRWKVLAVFWALIPAANALVFTRVPIASLIGEGEKGMSMKELFSNRVFWLFVLLMICAGASEQAVSQWASAFAEKGLGVSKAVGDLAGPAFFALLMGTARAIYGKSAAKIPVGLAIGGSSVLCIAAYLTIALSPSPVLSLIGVGVCGFSVGVFWPGTFSLAAASIRRGGTALFALLSLAGDLGCSGGPTLAGMVSGAFGDNLHRGILAAAVFPAIMLAGIILKKTIYAGKEK